MLLPKSSENKHCDLEPQLGQITVRHLSRVPKQSSFSKIGDSLKEIEETEYWLELLVDSGCVREVRMANLVDETRQLIAIFTTIDKNAKR